MTRVLSQIGSVAERHRRPLAKLLLALVLVMPATAGTLRQDGGFWPFSLLSAGSHGAFGPEGSAQASLVRSEAERMRLTGALAREYRVPIALADRITRAAVAESIHPRVAFELVSTESSFRRAAISRVGAVGYTQVMPATARWLEPGTSQGDLFQPETNLRLGFRYLHYLVDRYDGDLELALTAYNRGPGTVDRLVRLGHDPDNGYAAKVLKRHTS